MEAVSEEHSVALQLNYYTLIHYCLLHCAQNVSFTICNNPQEGIQAEELARPAIWLSVVQSGSIHFQFSHS